MHSTPRERGLTFPCIGAFTARHCGAQAQRLGHVLDRGGLSYRAAPKPSRAGDAGGLPWLSRTTQPKEAQ